MTAAVPKAGPGGPIDLVLSGGGVKGVGLVGAVVRLLEAGYRPNRVAGTSAGSIVGAILAAAAGTGEVGPEKIRDLAMSIDYRKFLDPGLLERVPLLGPAWAILEGKGVYKGDYARDFVASRLAELGVTTFGDLRLTTANSPRNDATGWWSPPPMSLADNWFGCRGTTAASTDWTLTSSPLPTRCGRRCRSRFCSGRSP